MRALAQVAGAPEKSARAIYVRHEHISKTFTKELFCNLKFFFFDLLFFSKTTNLFQISETFVNLFLFFLTL